MRRPHATGPPVSPLTPQSRTTTESSAKNRSAAALTTTTPSTEIIMAETIQTTAAGNAMPLSAALRPGGALLALDLGTKTGWAMALPDGGIVSGTVSFRPSRYDGGGMRYLRFRAWLNCVAEDTPGIGTIHFEEVRRHLSTDAAHVHGGLLATMTAWCEEQAVAYQGVPVGTIKRFITGRGNADKAAVMSAVRARGYSPIDDNEADALAILLWATETQGGVR